jgi:hypothetical protein
MAVEFEDQPFKVSVNPRDTNKVIVQEVKNEVKVAIGGPQGPKGDTGDVGATGDTGPAGQGVATGGTTGQVLAKNSNTNYDTAWVDQLSQENIQDYVAPLFLHSNHINANVTYEDASNELHIDVTNAPSAGYTSVVKHSVRLAEAISKGQAVYVSSSNGTNMVVSKASNASEATSSKTMGLLEASGNTNAQVNVVTEGLLAGLDTSTAVAGDPVWLGTSGNLIYGLVNKPYAPAHLVFIGIVTRVNQNNGEIFIKVQNGFELDELHNVDNKTNTPVDKNLLAFEAATSLWKNKSFSDLGLATTSDVSTAISNLVDSAPAALDTLNELAAALGDDASFATTVTNSLSDKVPKTGDTTITGTQTFTPSAIGNKPLIVNGLTGQTANLQEWQVYGSPLSYIKPNGTLFINATNNTAGIEFPASTGTNIIRANGNDLNFSPRFDMIHSPADSSGRLRPANDNTSDLGTSGQRWKNIYSSGLIITNSTSTNIVATIKGASGQSASLQEWQNSGGTPLSSVNASGKLGIGTGSNATLGDLDILAAAPVLNISSSTYKATGPKSSGIINFRSGGDTAERSIPVASIEGYDEYAGGGYEGSLRLSTINAATLSEKARITNLGFLLLNTTTSLIGTANTKNAHLGIVAKTADTVGIVVRGASSQTANLQEWQLSDGTVLARIASSGQLLAPSIVSSNFQITSAGILSVGTSTAISNTQAYVLSTSATNAGIIVRGAASQTADLLQIQNSSTTPISGFDAIGNLYANGTNYGFSTSIGAPASTTYWKIATLPATTLSTFDHVVVDAILDDSWGSAQKVNAKIIFGNRDGFTYRYYLNGTVRASTRILAYTEPDNSVSIYMRIVAGAYASFSYNITHTANATTYKNPTATTTAPTGTLAFDSNAIATYIPQAYAPFTGVAQFNGRTVAFLDNPVFVGSTVTAPTFTSNVAIGTAPLTVTSTTKVTNLNADLLDGYDSSTGLVANTVAVRDGAAALTAKSFQTSGYKTTGTGLTYVGQWTKVATFTLPGQFQNNVALIDFSSDGPGNTDIAHGRLFVSLKQQNAMALAPEVPTMILYNGFNATIDDFRLVVSQNDASATKFDLYFRNNNYYQTVAFTPVILSAATYTAFYENQPYVINTPEGFTNSAVNSPETEIIPLDNLANDFNGVSNRYLMKHQGVAVPMRNPFRLLVSVNGVLQTVNTPDYVWQSPIAQDGFFLDSDGYITFSEAPTLGSTFDGRIIAGAATSTKTKNYPFRAVDLLVGA